MRTSCWRSAYIYLHLKVLAQNLGAGADLTPLTTELRTRRQVCTRVRLGESHRGGRWVYSHISQTGRPLACRPPQSPATSELFVQPTLAQLLGGAGPWAKPTRLLARSLTLSFRLPFHPSGVLLLLRPGCPHSLEYPMTGCLPLCKPK